MGDQLILANKAVNNANNLLKAKKRDDALKLKNNRLQVKEMFDDIKAYGRLLKAEDKTVNATGHFSKETDAVRDQIRGVSDKIRDSDWKIFNLAIERQNTITRRTTLAGIAASILIAAAAVFTNSADLIFTTVGVGFGTAAAWFTRRIKTDDLVEKYEKVYKS